MNKPPQVTRPSSRPMPPRRGFRRWSVLQLMIAGLLVVILLAVVGLYIKYRIDLQPVAQAGCVCAPITFTVKAGENAPTIGANLKYAGLIRNRNAFVTYVNLHGLRPKLKVGTYTFTAKSSIAEIADTIAAGRTLTKRLVVPEGSRLSQIEDLAADQGIARSDFQAALAAPHAQTFLKDKPAGVNLEGYLFPDSYEIDATTTASSLVTTMLDTFGARVGQEYVDGFAAQGLTLHQGVTLASIVEREVNIEADRPIVAQIFLKRFKSGQQLGSDVTTHYAADLLGVKFDVDLNSPYNTRRVVGLPPGPIASPGLGAMDAVIHPAATDYTYFLTGTDGKTYFAKTYAEHQANIAKHLR